LSLQPDVNQADTPLSSSDLDKLEHWLDSDVFHEDAMPLDMLQGLLCAVSSAPDLIPPSKWLPAALGENPSYETPEQAEEILRLVMRFYQQTLFELEDGGNITLYIFPNEEGEEDLAIWCEGYLEGLLLSDVDWYEHGDSAEVDELLFPFLLLAGRMREIAQEAGNPLPSIDEEREMKHKAAAAIGDSVMAMYSYWLDRRIAQAPERRGNPRMGHNDPCFCGSGAKYRNCHGKAH
jgi:uncharacterized protein